MPRSLAVLLACGLLILSSLALATGAAAATIAPTTTCSNDSPNTAGLGVICEVTVVNTITATGGTATVTVRECHGAANDAEAACVTTTDVLSEPVTAVTQCNDILMAARRSNAVSMSRTTTSASTRRRRPRP